jgi:protein tyrosine/serine phosphatase
MTKLHFSWIAVGLLLSLDVGANVAPVSIISDFHVVTDGIYRGARPKTEGINALNQMHVKTVIDLQGGDSQTLGWFAGLFEPGEKQSNIDAERDQVQGLGMNFFNFPLNALKDIDDRESIMITQALQIMADPNFQPVYIHCEHGHDRTGLVVALYRVFDMGWTPKAAHDEMVALGHSGFFNRLVTHDLDEAFYSITQSQPE